MNHKVKILKVAYLKEKTNNHADLFSRYVKQFMEDCPEYVEYMTNLEDQINSQASEELQKKHKDTKKLYRRISKITHPDKTNSDYLSELFKQSSEDYQNNRIGSLFYTATQLNIDVSDLDISFILDQIDSEITTYEESVDKFTGSVPWKWAHTKNENEKRLLKEQIDTFFGIKKWR